MFSLWLFVKSIYNCNKSSNCCNFIKIQWNLGLFLFTKILVYHKIKIKYLHIFNICRQFKKKPLQVTQGINWWLLLWQLESVHWMFCNIVESTDIIWYISDQIPSFCRYFHAGILNFLENCPYRYMNLCYYKAVMFFMIHLV